MTIRVIELFSGIGAQAEALKELGLDYEVVATSDISKKANIGYEAIHGPVNNLGDITKIEHLPECDLLTYSYPCVSISTAGKREGFKEGSGTESALVWEVGRLLKDMRERECLPEVLLMENVDALLSKKFKPTFDKWCNLLSEMGYCNSYQIMNAKDYGTPQSRKRVFMVSTLTLGEFIFPEPCPDGRVLKDILEEDVDESYFLSDKRVASFRFNQKMTDTDRLDVGELNIEGWHRTARAVVGENGQAPTVCKSANNLRTKVITEIDKVGEIEDEKFDQDKRVYSKNGLSPTLRVGGGSAKDNKITVAGVLTDSKVIQDRQVYDVENVGPTITGAQGSGSRTKIIIAGLLTDTTYIEAKRGMDEKGISRTITAEHGGICFPKILVRK